MLGIVPKHVKGPRAVTSLNGDVKVLLGLVSVTATKTPSSWASPQQPDVDAVADSTVALTACFPGRT